MLRFYFFFEKSNKKNFNKKIFVWAHTKIFYKVLLVLFLQEKNGFKKLFYFYLKGDIYVQKNLSHSWCG